MLGTSATKSPLPVYDRKLALAKVGGNARIADELLGLLIDDLPGLSAALRNARAEGGFESVREIAHRIHGAACYCATLALEHAAMKLEQAATRGDDAAISVAHDELQVEMERLIAERRWKTSPQD